MEAGTQQIISYFFSPAALGAVVWYLLQHYTKNQNKILQEISDSVAAMGKEISGMKTQVALVEQKAAIVEQLRLDMQELRVKVARVDRVDALREDLKEMNEKLIKADSKIDAAWRFIERERK